MKPTSIIFLVLSLILIVTGYISMEMATTLAENDGTGLYADDTLDEDGNRLSTVLFNSNDYDKIEINVSDATVYLLRGDEEKVVFKNYTEGSHTEIKSGVSYVISDNLSAIDMITSGKFNLTFKGLRHYWHDREILSRPKEVFVYTTENTALNSVEIRLGKGTVKIVDYEAAFDVMAYVTDGVVEATGSKATSFNLSGSKCTINAGELIADRFHSDVDNGKVNMRNCDISTLTKIKIKETGEVEVGVDESMSEYNIVAYASKKVYINGKDMGTQYPSENTETPDAGDTSGVSRTLDINVASGTVAIMTNK